MKDPEIPVAGFQDAGSTIPEVLPEGMLILYHTHGERQYLGTAKFHVRPDCPHLRHWRPSMTFGPTRKGERMSKTIMREDRKSVV